MLALHMASSRQLSAPGGTMCSVIGFILVEQPALRLWR